MKILRLATLTVLYSVAAAASAQASAASDLKQNMRKLWTDHVVWTRDYVIAAVAD